MHFWYLKHKLILLSISTISFEGYATPFRLDRNANGGGILLYVSEDIPSTLLNSDLLIEGFFET